MPILVVGGPLGTITKVKEFEIQPRIVDTVFTAAGFWKMTKDWIHVYKMTINFITADSAPIVKPQGARCVIPKCSRKCTACKTKYEVQVQLLENCDILHRVLCASVLRTPQCTLSKGSAVQCSVL